MGLSFCSIEKGDRDITQAFRKDPFCYSVKSEEAAAASG